MTTYPIKLPPLAEIKAKALAALEAGELQCQQPGFDPGETSCSYAGPCAIGVALPPELRSQLDNSRDPNRGLGTSICSLISRGILQEAVPGDQLTLQEMQKAHDDGSVTRLRALLTA